MKNRKWILGLGTIAAIATPISAVVACGSKKAQVPSQPKVWDEAAKIKMSKDIFPDVKSVLLSLVGEVLRGSTDNYFESYAFLINKWASNHGYTKPFEENIDLSVIRKQPEELRKFATGIYENLLSPLLNSGQVGEYIKSLIFGTGDTGATKGIEAVEKIIKEPNFVLAIGKLFQALNLEDNQSPIFGLFKTLFSPDKHNIWEGITIPGKGSVDILSKILTWANIDDNKEIPLRMVIREDFPEVDDYRIWKNIDIFTMNPDGTKKQMLSEMANPNAIAGSFKKMYFEDSELFNYHPPRTKRSASAGATQEHAEPTLHTLDMSSISSEAIMTMLANTNLKELISAVMAKLQTMSILHFEKNRETLMTRLRESLLKRTLTIKGEGATLRESSTPGTSEKTDSLFKYIDWANTDTAHYGDFINQLAEYRRLHSEFKTKSATAEEISTDQSYVWQSLINTHSLWRTVDGKTPADDLVNLIGDSEKKDELNNGLIKYHLATFRDVSIDNNPDQRDTLGQESNKIVNEQIITGIIDTTLATFSNSGATRSEMTSVINKIKSGVSKEEFMNWLPSNFSAWSRAIAKKLFYAAHSYEYLLSNRPAKGTVLQAAGSESWQKQVVFDSSYSTTLQGETADVKAKYPDITTQQFSDVEAKEQTAKLMQKKANVVADSKELEVYDKVIDIKFKAGTVVPLKTLTTVGHDKYIFNGQELTTNELKWKDIVQSMEIRNLGKGIIDIFKDTLKLVVHGASYFGLPLIADNAQTLTSSDLTGAFSDQATINALKVLTSSEVILKDIHNIFEAYDIKDSTHRPAGANTALPYDQVIQVVNNNSNYSDNLEKLLNIYRMQFVTNSYNQWAQMSSTIIGELETYDGVKKYMTNAANREHIWPVLLDTLFAFSDDFTQEEKARIANLSKFDTNSFNDSDYHFIADKMATILPNINATADKYVADNPQLFSGTAPTTIAGLTTATIDSTLLAELIAKHNVIPELVTSVTYFTDMLQKIFNPDSLVH